jgi:PBP1b-binding outer membrane lipoprotein LpoB
MTMRAMILLPALLLSGCINTVGSVVTAPFKVAGKAADWATTSQDEADRNRGRYVRKAEERARRNCKRQVDGDLAREQCVRDTLRAQGIT